jgi:hypothetical protein
LQASAVSVGRDSLRLERRLLLTVLVALVSGCTDRNDGAPSSRRAAAPVSHGANGDCVRAWNAPGNGANRSAAAAKHDGWSVSLSEWVIDHPISDPSGDDLVGEGCSYFFYSSTHWRSYGGGWEADADLRWGMPHGGGGRRTDEQQIQPPNAVQRRGKLERLPTDDGLTGTTTVSSTERTAAPPFEQRSHTSPPTARASTPPVRICSPSWSRSVRPRCAVSFRARNVPDHKFSESGALSSSTPTDLRRSALRLVPTAYWCGLDLLASRARCKGQARGGSCEGQARRAGICRKLRPPRELAGGGPRSMPSCSASAEYSGKIDV